MDSKMLTYYVPDHAIEYDLVTFDLLEKFKGSLDKLQKALKETLIFCWLQLMVP